MAIATAAAPRALAWSIHGPFVGRGDRDYEAIAAEAAPEQVAINKGRSLGHAALDIRFYAPGTVVPGGNPPPLRRSFVTRAGWPNAAYSTTDRRLGVWLSAGGASDGTVSDAALDDGEPTRHHILWSGFVFDSLFYAALLLITWAALSRRGPARLLVAGICAGLPLALVVAWGCDLAHHTVAFLPKDSRSVAPPASLQAPMTMSGVAHSGIHTTSLGFRAVHHAISRPLEDGRLASLPGSSLIEIGWPMKCLEGEQPDQWSQDRARHVYSLMSVPVRWPGLLVNWAFYSLLVYLLIGLPLSRRTRRRLRQQRCTACGYMLGDIDRCPECGAVSGGHASG